MSWEALLVKAALLLGIRLLPSTWPSPQSAELFWRNQIGIWLTAETAPSSDKQAAFCTETVPHVRLHPCAAGEGASCWARGPGPGSRILPSIPWSLQRDLSPLTFW